MKAVAEAIIRRLCDALAPGRHLNGVTRNEKPATQHLSTIARSEGWDIFDCGFRVDGTPRIELQREDNPPEGAPTFDTDADAWAFVVARARAGSALHLRALHLLDPIEQSMIRIRCFAADILR